MVTSQYWFTGLLPVARDMVFQKGECIVCTQKARLSPGGGKRKKLLTSVLAVFLRSCAYTCVSSYLIDGRQGKFNNGIPRQLLFVLYPGQLHCNCRRIRLNSLFSKKKQKEQEKKKRKVKSQSQ